jgi:thiol-disulfide isomerase/thioredoxin
MQPVSDKGMRFGHTRRNCLRLGVAWLASHAAAGSAGAAETMPWPAGKALPALDAVDLSGRAWTLSALRGRAVLLNFWASWCEPCRAEMPTLQQLADFYGEDRLAVLALNFKEAPGTAARFAARTGLKLPVLLDPAGEVARRWEVKVFPTTVLIGADGRPRWRVRGEMDWTTLEAGRMVEALFAQHR